MAELVPGVVGLSAFVDTVLARLCSPKIVNLIREEKHDHMLLQRLETTLLDIQAVLNETEDKQIQNSAVKKWLDYLIDAVYGVDDLLDQISTKSETQEKVRAETQEEEEESAETQEEEVTAEIQEEESAATQEKESAEIQVKIIELIGIIHRLESIVEHKDFFGLKGIPRVYLASRTGERIPTSLVEGYNNIYGRDHDKEAIIKLLLDDNSDAKISVIPIVGMGGIGKTTLAQSLFNDDNLMQNFNLKAWVCVGEDFDILKVTKTIIEAVTLSTCNTEDFNFLQLRLKQKLSGRKFLIVLDDIWNEHCVQWNTFQIPFQCGMKGSKILVTTRGVNVASLVQTVPFYILKPLPDDDSWFMFVKHAFLSLEEFSENLTRGKLGKEIVKKCNGLPLAVRTLGCLLRTKHSIRDWNNILNYIWKSSENWGSFMPALTVCYHYLPAHLKRCFAYCSLYPKVYKFNKDELISLWMAQGLLRSSNSEKTLEEVGNEYFDDLVSRSFLQHFSIGSSSSYFVMHDIIHDLATFKAQELRTFLPLNFTADLSMRILSTSHDTRRWIQILSFPSLMLPTTSSPSILPPQWMVLIRIQNLRIRLEACRLMSFVSSVVGLLCHALSPSFSRLIGGWNSFKFILYGVVAFLICATTLFAKQCSLSSRGKLKAHVGFVVLMLTSVYSFLYDKAVNGKPDLLSMISNGAFALMSLSLSRQLKLGFEVGLFAFFLGFLAVQLMTIKLVLILVAIIYGYPLYVIHSNSGPDYLP